MRLELSWVRGGVATIVSVILASCATSSAPPPVARGGGYVDVGLAGEAAAFESFTRKASAIPPAFSSPAAVADGLQTGAAYDPRQLQSGMIAYAAMAALQEPGFVAAVKRQNGRDLARRLSADPDAALSLPGGAAAAGRASAALARRGEALADAGQRVKRSAYTVQREAWSRARVPNAAARLARVKQAASYQRGDSDTTTRLVAAVSEGGHRGGSSPVVSRGVALAALTVLGQDGPARSLMTEPRSGMCLRLAKLNFHQCLASAGTHYEDIYCLGVHALAETGQCVVAATRQAPVTRRAAL